MGSVRVSRVGERVLAITNSSLQRQAWKVVNSRKGCFGATPKPAREARALPKQRRIIFFGAPPFRRATYVDRRG